MAARSFLLTVQADMDIAAYRRKSRELVRDTRQGAQQAGRAWDGINAHVRGNAQIIGTASTALKGYFAIMAAQVGPAKLKQYSDTWTNIGNRLRVVTDTAGELGAAQDSIYKIALQTRQPLDATAEVYQRITQNAGKLHLTQQQIAGVVGTISKAVALSGVSAQNAEQGIRQLAQGLASGVLRGQDLRSVLDQLPGVSKALADGLGTDIGGLRKLAEQGKLTAEEVVRAFQRSADGVDASFAKLQFGFDQAFTNLETRATRYIGQLNESIGASRHFGDALEVVGGNLDTLAAGLGAFGTYKIARLFGAMTSSVVDSTKALYANTVGAAKNAIGQQASSAAALRRADAERFVAIQAAQGAREDVAAAVAAEKAATADHAAAVAAYDRVKSTRKAKAAKKAMRQAEVALQEAQKRTVATTRASTVATGVAAEKSLALSRAQKVAAASTLTLRRAGSAVLGVFGGPVGLIATLASVAVGMLLFRDNTDEAANSLVDLQTPLDQAIAKYKELDRAQQLKTQHELAAKTDESRLSATRALGDLYSGVLQSTGNTPAYYAATQQISDLVKQANDGAISVRAASDQIIQAIDGIAARGGLTAKQKAGLQDQAAAWAKNAQTVQDYQSRLAQFESKAPATQSAIQRTGDALTGQGQSAATAAGKWDDYLAKLDQSVRQAGITGEALAKLQARAQGYSPEQVDLVGNLSQQQTLLTQYQQALASGDKKQAESVAKTLTGLAETEAALRRVVDVAGGGKALIATMQQQFSNGQWLGAGKTFLDSFLGDDADQVAAIKARLKKQLAIIASTTTPTPKGGGGGAQLSEQQKITRALQERITKQNELAQALAAYGLEATRWTDTDRQVWQLAQAIASEKDDEKRAVLSNELALAREAQAKEHANDATRQQLELAQRAAQAEREMTRALADRQRQHARELAAVGQGDTQREQAQRLQAIDDEYRRRRQAYEDAGNPMDDAKARAYFATLDRLRQQDIEEERQYQQQLAAERGNWVNGATRAFENYIGTASDTAKQTDDLFSHAFQGMEDSLVSFVTTGKLDFKGLVSSILKDLIRMEARILISKVLTSIIGYFAGGSVSSVGSGTTGTIFSGGSYAGYAAKGKAFGGGGREITAFARGGVVHSPTMFRFASGTGLMGEAGPEAIMPLKRGSDGKLGVAMHGGGGGGVVINQSFNIDNGAGSGTDAARSGDAARQFAARMKQVAKQTIADEQRPGGSLWRMAHA